MAGATHVLPRAWPRTSAWRRRSFRRAVTFYLLISPWLVGFILLGAVPLAGAFVMSFTNYDGLNLDYVRFVGTDNYARAFGDSDAQYALGRTLLLMAVVVPIGLALQLALALMVNQPIRFSNVFRTIFYLPYVIPLVALVIFFNLVTRIIVALQILVQPMLLSPGVLGLNPGTVPPRDNYLYAVHAYIEIFTKQLFGYGSALLWLLSRSFSLSPFCS